MKIKGIKLGYFAAGLSVIAILLGIWTTFFQSRGFVQTTATIVSVEEVPGEVDDTDYVVTVEYDVDGTHYTEKLDSYSPSYKEGKTVNILYDPENPSVIHSGGWMGIYMIVVGALILAVVLVSAVRAKKDLSALREMRPETSYAPSVTGEERHLYFLTDRGTAKFGHRIEDKDRRVLYEAKVTKFRLTAPVSFDFIDHEHGRTTPHLIGQTENTEWDTLLIDNHSTFSFDGEDIWKHLKRSGITVDARFLEGKPLWTKYTICRDGREIARVESSSMYPHEEDAEARGRLGNLVPVRGFYRIWTREQNLSLLFVTLLAFARSEANDGEGGNYGLLFHKKRRT